MTPPIIKGANCRQMRLQQRKPKRRPRKRSQAETTQPAPPRPAALADTLKTVTHMAAVTIPPLVVILLLGAIWELSAPETGGLPRPTTSWTES